MQLAEASQCVLPKCNDCGFNVTKYVLPVTYFAGPCNTQQKQHFDIQAFFACVLRLVT